MFWDVVFSGSSALLAIFLGAALGNVVRGVPLDAMGWFFLPLWTDFRIGPQPGILDWYTVTVGLTALFTITLHGALWVVNKTEEELQQRARRLASGAWWSAAAFTLLITGMTFQIQPHIASRMRNEVWGWIFPLVAIAGLVSIRWFSRKQADDKAFLASCAYIIGMLTSVAFGVYPYVLLSSTNPALSLDISNAATSAYGLKVALAWFIPGIVLTAIYFVYVYRTFAGKVRLEGRKGVDEVGQPGVG